MKIKKYTGYEGVRLAADVGGDPSHPSVIFIHGAGQTRHSWKKAAHELISMGYYVISLDLRGHGDSDWAKNGDYSLNAYTQDLNIIISTLQTRPALVGASFGGVISLITAAESVACNVSAIILIDVVPRMEQSGIDAITAFMLDNKEGFSNVNEAAESVAKYIPHREKPKNDQGLMKNLRLKDDGRYYWHWDPEFMKGDLNNFITRMEAAARHCMSPTLLLKGERSELVSESGVKALLELIPHAEFIQIGNTGHMVAGDSNDAFNKAIESFISDNILL